MTQGASYGDQSCYDCYYQFLVLHHLINPIAKTAAGRVIAADGPLSRVVAIMAASRAREVTCCLSTVGLGFMLKLPNGV
jgi:hypothetical protein